MKGKNFFWGMFFILIAALIIANQFGLFGEINVISFVLSILLILAIIKSIINTNVWGICIPLALILIINYDLLGIKQIAPIYIFGSAIFLSIGLSFFIKPKHYRCEEYYCSEEVENIEQNGTVNIISKFGGSIKYINSENLKKANLYCSCSGTKVYLDNAKLQDNEAILNMDVRCSGVELYIPKEWVVQNRISAFFGGITEKGIKQNTSENKLILTGRISFSGVEIIYI